MSLHIASAQPQAGNSIRASVSPEEWQARLDLAAAYRLGARLGWHDLLGTHFSARVPGTTDQFLVNPFGLFFEEITASSLVKIDKDGKVLSDSPHGVNKAADVIHGAVYAARPDVNAILHLHSVAGVGVAAQKDGLLPISQSAAIIAGRVRYYDFTGVKLDRDECRNMAAALEDQNILILRNHGTLMAGRTIGEAFAFTVRTERAFQIQLAAQASGAPLLHIEPHYLQEAADFGHTLYTDSSWSPGAHIEWAAFKRKIDREDPGYAA
ncbi:MAG: class II aldolase/adducin family protein [Janthinobacterium lividum]